MMERQIAFLAACLLGLGCGSGGVSTKEEAQAPPPPAVEEAAVAEVEPAPEPEPYPPGLQPFVAPWKGDLDGMVERRIVRVLSVQNPVLYFVDRGRELGLTYE